MLLLQHSMPLLLGTRYRQPVALLQGSSSRGHSHPGRHTSSHHHSSNTSLLTVLLLLLHTHTQQRRHQQQHLLLLLLLLPTEQLNHLGPQRHHQPKAWVPSPSPRHQPRPKLRSLRLVPSRLLLQLLLRPALLLLLLLRHELLLLLLLLHHARRLLPRQGPCSSTGQQGPLSPCRAPQALT